MKKIRIYLKSIIDAKNFCDRVKNFDFDIELVSGKSTANAKDVMDVLTLDLSEDVTVIAHTANAQILEEQIKEFIV